MKQLVLIMLIWVCATSAHASPLAISDVDVQQTTSGTMRVQGKLTNNSGKRLTDVTAWFLLWDPEGASTGFVRW